METPDRPRSKRRSDRVLERPRRPALDRSPAGAGHHAGAGLRCPDRPRQAQCRRAHRRCRLRLRGDVGCAGAAGRPGRSCQGHRHLGADARSGAAGCACGFAGRFCPRGRNGLPVRAREFRSAVLALRRDVLCRARAFLCQYAQGIAAIGAAGVRLLAGAARKPVDDDAAAGGLPTRPQDAATGTGRSRPVRICIRSARAADPERSRFLRT